MQEDKNKKKRGRTPGGKKEYSPGDTLHILITQDFVPTANEFFEFCREHNYNASEVIRSGIEKWLREKKELEGKSISYDKKLLDLVKDTIEKKKRAEEDGIKVYKL